MRPTRVMTPAVGEEGGQLPRAPDRLSARSASVKVRSRLRPVRRLSPSSRYTCLPYALDEALLEGGGDGGLAGAGASRHPQRRALLTQGGVPPLRGEVARALVGVGVGGAALDDVRGGGLERLGAERPHVHGGRIDEAVAAAALLGVGGVRQGGHGHGDGHLHGGSDGSRHDGGREGLRLQLLGDGSHAAAGRPLAGPAQHEHDGEQDAYPHTHRHALVDQLVLPVAVME